MSGAGYLMSRMHRDPEVAEHKLPKGIVKRVLNFAAPFRRMIVLFLILVVISSALSVAPPLLLKKIIDDGIDQNNPSLVVWLAGVVALIAVIDAGLTLVQRWYSARIGESLIFDLRTRVFDHVLGMPLAFFTRAQTGKLVSRLNTDVIGAQRAFTSTLSTVVSNVVSLVLVLGVMISLSPVLTLGALILLPIFVIPARILGNRLASLTHQQMQYNADMAAEMTERFSVSGALLVKLFGKPSVEHTRFAHSAAAVRETAVKIAMNSRVFMTSLALVAALATALIYGVGGVFVIDQKLEIGTLIALALYLTQLYGPLTQLTTVRVDIMSTLVSFERVFEMLDLKPSIADAENARESNGPASVEFEHVGFRYPTSGEVSLASLESAATSETRPDKPVLHDVSFSVRPGQTVALVGSSGAGKTTITHLVARLYDVGSGRVLIGGVDVRELRQESLQSRMGYVTQDAHMFHDTILANLLYAKPEASDEEIFAALDAAQIGSLIRELPAGLETVVGERGYRLSGGERQRLAIARLLLKSPPIVVLDEATAHLDSESEAAVQKALDVAMEGRTSIVIAHRLATVRDADEILVLRDGKIVERGRHPGLIEAGGLYADLYRTQFASVD